jgi:hypothetical protein
MALGETESDSKAMVDGVGLKAFLLHVFRFACVSEDRPFCLPRAGGGEADLDVTKSRKKGCI